jgi:hypothetical protein
VQCALPETKNHQEGHSLKKNSGSFRQQSGTILAHSLIITCAKRFFHPSKLTHLGPQKCLIFGSSKKVFFHPSKMTYLAPA